MGACVDGPLAIPRPCHRRGECRAGSPADGVVRTHLGVAEHDTSSEPFANGVQVLDPSSGAVPLNLRVEGGHERATPCWRGRRHATRLPPGSPFPVGSAVDATNPADVLLDGAPFGIPIIIPLGLASDGATLCVADW